MTDPVADADMAAEQLLRLYEMLGVSAVLLTLVDDVIVARCQSAEDVLPMCKQVVSAHAVPDVRTVN